jgi:hemolysin activation/secretion protein
MKQREKRRNHLHASTLLASGALLALAAPAFAQTTAPVTQTSPLPHIAPVAPALPAGEVPSTGAPAPEAPLPSLTIPVGSVTIIGATAFPPAQLNAIVAGLANSQQKLSRLETARRALLDLYRGNGYVLSTVMLAIDANGNARFIVTEGRIVDVKLSQDIGPAGTMVLGFLNHLTQERPLREASLERWLLLAQQIPGVSVHAVLQAGSADPGALTLVAEVSLQHESALVTADNRGFDNTGPQEGLAVVDLNSLTSLGDQTEVSFFHTSQSTDNFGQFSESFFLGNSGLRAQLYGGVGRANPSGTLGLAQYHSRLTVFGGRLSYPVLLRRALALNVDLRLDATQNMIITDSVLTSEDNLRVLRGGTDLAWEDLWAGGARDALNVVQAQMSYGIPALGASADGRTAPPAGRASERIDFWKISGSVSRTQTLLTPLPATSLDLRLEAGGQYACDILPSAEEFYLGGSRYTRGFYSGQVVGDRAAYATAELQLNTGYDFSVFGQDIAFGAQTYGFYDYGETWANLSTDLSHRISSYGGGVKLGLNRIHSVELDGEIVRRLTTRLQPASSGVAALPEDMIYWGVTARY